MSKLPQRVVDVPTLEHELNELWERMTEVSSGEDEQAVMRACVANLVVYSSGPDSIGETSQIMAQVTNQHPSRVIVLIAEPDTLKPSLNAMVTAQCHPSGRGQKQICCEQIIIQAAGQEIGHLPSLVRSLVIADLPVFLWWRDSLDFQAAIFTGLVQSCDRVIIDSAGLPAAQEGLRTLVALIEERAQVSAFSDLNWSRLTPWRVLVAGFFDAPECRPYLARLDRVEVESSVRSSHEHSLPAESLLLAAWLASRLKWKSTAKPRWIDEHTYQWELQAQDRTVMIQIKITSSASGAGPGLNSLQLLVENEPSARFSACIALDDQHLESHVTLEGKQEVARVIRFPDEDEAQLVSREMEILGHDKVYEQGLKWLDSNDSGR
ncbi:MAG: glucose-6-phosphate dehydrogenase assembly protein OpcA [Acidobacteria bacterium]|nr:glucose-6-phosphate dehydrogenase assembly protein OpcA [Acidobacteriota bacterium]MCZ6879294.1 glucose-6-phosphate dehydrogenase assembly protein OpcA [Acidobacteriota bacterium]